MIRSLNDLLVVEVGRLILHEAHDANRLAHLRHRVESEGFQQNPVIVSAFGDSYLVLDGAHRVRGISELGCRFILVQVVEPPEKAESWTHVLRDVTPQKLREIENVVTSGRPDRWLADIKSADGRRAFVGIGDKSLDREVDALWSLQSLYPGEELVRRVEAGVPVELGSRDASIRYRDFTPEELVEIVRAGLVLPAGITRFRVRERILGLRFPLKKLEDGDLAGRNKELRSLVAERLEQNRVRYYSEPVVLFE